MGVRAHNGGMLLGAQAVEVLLRAGADLNCTDNGETSPLFFAASGGHVEVPLPDQTSTLAGRLRVPHPPADRIRIRCVPLRMENAYASAQHAVMDVVKARS